MTGDEHYQTAEKLLAAIDSKIESRTTSNVSEATVGRAIEILIQNAQVHATLALAAATLDAAFVGVPHSTGQSVSRDRIGEGYGR